jgi:hypothetical protein
VRELADAERIRRFMKELGAAAREDARVYFTGGATAVLEGWRPTTIDVDVKLVPEREEILRELPRLKEELQLNVELAAPSDFIPVADGWEDRSPFVRREGRISFHHFDLHAQALAKAERGHEQDVSDARTMIERGLVNPGTLRELLDRIEPELYRFPAVDPRSLRRAVNELLQG